MATYIIQTTINPGVFYEVDEAEYQQLKELGILLNNNPEPLAGVFDREVSALVQDVNSQTYLRLTQLPLAPHTHLTTDISDSGSTGRALLKTTSALDARTAIGALAASAVGAASGVAQLDSNGKIPQSQLPAVALTEFLGAVASQTAMLALDGQRGDWATRTDRGTDFQLIAEPASTLANWREMTYPASPVSSVDGRTGAVTLGTVAASANELARRGSTGTLLVATATQAGEATTLSQQTTAIMNATTSFGRDRGSAAAWPSTDLRRGDVAYHTGVAAFGVYNGTRWVMEELGTVATVAARDALSWVYEGAQIKVTATGAIYRYNGSRWDTLSMPATLLAVSNSFANFNSDGTFQGLRFWATDRTGHISGFLQATAAISAADYAIATIPDTGVRPRTGTTAAAGKVSSTFQLGGVLARCDINTNGSVVISTPATGSGSIGPVNMTWPLD